MVRQAGLEPAKAVRPPDLQSGGFAAHPLTGESVSLLAEVGGELTSRTPNLAVAMPVFEAGCRPHGGTLRGGR